MLVLKTVYRNGRCFQEVVDEKFDTCPFCGRQKDIGLAICGKCEDALNNDQDDQQLQNERTQS